MTKGDIRWKIIERELLKIDPKVDLSDWYDNRYCLRLIFYNEEKSLKVADYLSFLGIKYSRIHDEIYLLRESI